MARLFGTLEGAKSTASRTGDDRLTARLATWHGAVVVTLDDYGTWTVHTEPADAQEAAAAAVPRIAARGNVHTGRVEASYGTLGFAGLGALAYRRGDDPTPTHPNRSPARKPGPDWTPYTTEERSR